jgi:hypothetical protein
MKTSELDINICATIPDSDQDFQIDILLALRKIRDGAIDIDELETKILEAVSQILTEYGDVEERDSE